MQPIIEYDMFGCVKSVTYQDTVHGQCADHDKAHEGNADETAIKGAANAEIHTDSSGAAKRGRPRKQ